MSRSWGWGRVSDVPTPTARMGSTAARALERSSGAVAVPGNAVTFLFDGPEIFPEMHRLIREARHRIHFENYIIHDDTCGNEFADALIARARDGVIVRVLYDWLGSSSTSRKYWNRLREAGIEVRAFGPPTLSRLLAFVSRDHRKLMVVDGSRAVTGGHCIGDEWVGDPARGRQPWRDTAVRVDGPAARLLDQSFTTTWGRAGGAPPDDATEVGHEVVPAGETAVRVVANRPGAERTWRTLDLLLAIGGDRIWVTEAYLAGPPRLYQVFEDAARDGVDVRLLVPGASDIPLVRNISRTGYKRLLRAGIRIWEWQGPMLHAKTVAIDGRWVRVGSSNLNPSSLVANWEVDLFIESPELARELDRRFVADLARSSEIVSRPRRFVPAVPGFGQATALETALPERRPDGTRHRPGARELRRRALQQAVGLSRAAHAALLGPLLLVLLGWMAILLFFPVAASYVTAGLIALLVAYLGLRGWLAHLRQ